METEKQKQYIDTNKTRTNKITIRVTETELELINQKAKEAKLPKNQYMINKALEEETTSYNGYLEIIKEIKKIGVNINQVARKINYTDEVTADDMEQLLKEHDKLWQLLKQSILEHPLNEQ